MTRAARILAAVMGLCVLVVAPAASPEKTGGSTRGPSLRGQVKGTGDETKRMYVTQDMMSAFARRAAHAAALEAADEAIEELQRLLVEIHEALVHEKRYRDDLEESIVAGKAEIVRLRGEIDDLKDEIDDVRLTLMIPGMSIHYENLMSDLDSLERKRDAVGAAVGRSASELDRTQGVIKKLERQIGDVRRRLHDRKEEKKNLKRQMLDVSVISPSEGARILAGSREELRLRCMKPPGQVRIEIQHAPAVRSSTVELAKRGETDRLGPAQPQQFTRTSGGWQPFYDWDWRWADLDRAGPDTRRLRFETVEGARERARARGTLKLGTGQYRVRVSPGAPGWRTFSVVGRIESKAFQQKRRVVSPESPPSKASEGEAEESGTRIRAPLRPR